MRAIVFTFRTFYFNIDLAIIIVLGSSGSRNVGEGVGARNMKYKPPHSVAIFFWAYFY